MTINHGTEVDYACTGDFKKMVQGPSRCHLGIFKPNKPMCLHPSVTLNYTMATGDQDHYYGDHKDGKRKGSSRSPLLAVSKKSCP
ncbi:unnamed protein product, partial [Allacma fusca]